MTKPKLKTPLSTAKNKRRAALYALTCVALWAFIPVIARLGQRLNGESTALDSHQLLFWSSAFSMLTMLVLCLLPILQKKRSKLAQFRHYRRQDWLQAMVLGFLGTYLYFLLLYQGYRSGRGMEVLIVQYSWPIFIALLSVVILKEAFDWRKKLALLLGFSAIVLVISDGQLQQLFSLANLQQPQLLLYVAAGAFCFALFSVLSKRLHLEATALMLVFFSVATLASFISMLSVSAFTWPQGNQWLIVIASGVMVNGLSDLLWLAALRQTQASFLAPFIFITPILSTLYFQLFFDDAFLAVHALAVGLIVLAGLVNSLKLRSK